jgi:tRNA-2-methylthio-N6-dimethylallyladenosine synthase
MKQKTFYINTIGCQMNVYDSERMSNQLSKLGYDVVSSPSEADLIIVNTCAVREKAEQKVFSFLGRLAALKRKKPELLIGVGGCVAQQEGERMIKRVPWIDFIFGTRAIGRLSQIVDRVAQKRCRIIDIEMKDTIEMLESDLHRHQEGKASAFVTIMRGCDNYCTYCVVPYVRGREISRVPDKIVEEIKILVDQGVREVTLLGQNVNSYGKKEGLCSFPELLHRVNRIAGVRRIRFTTSHPKDLSEELINAFGDLSKLCRHIHLPVQAGSNRILKRMNRKYSREQYLKKIEQLRRIDAGIAVTSDFMVGFPGETRADFKETLRLIRQVEYDGVFAFKYSDRPNAPAAGYTDKVPEEEKSTRLQELLELQEGFTRRKNLSLVGSTQLILVDGFSKEEVSRHPAPNPPRPEPSERDIEWTGRTSSNKIVNFIQNSPPDAATEIFPGRLINVKIEKAFSHSLWGAPKKEPEGHQVKGEKNHAA